MKRCVVDGLVNGLTLFAESISVTLTDFNVSAVMPTYTGFPSCFSIVCPVARSLTWAEEFGGEVDNGPYTTSVLAGATRHGLR